LKPIAALRAATIATTIHAMRAQIDVSSEVPWRARS
jgi:hypothetical protein